MVDIPNLERRRIQAEIVKPIYDELLREIGPERTRALLERAVSGSVQSEARRAAAAQPEQAQKDMRAFGQNFVDTYESRGAESGLDVDVLRLDGEHLDFNVTRCRFVEMYEEMGLGEVADVLSCNRDGQFATAFDPSISLDRPQTIAKGAPTCIFRYSYKNPA